MAISTDIKDMFKAMNGSWSSRIFTLALIAFLGYATAQIFTAKGKVKCEDCSPFKEQNKELISALIDIRKDLSSVQSTSFNQLQPELIMFASLDSVPKKGNQMQQVQQRVINKIDSIILKYRIKQDSVTKKSKT